MRTLIINSNNVVPDGQNNKFVYKFPNSVQFKDSYIAFAQASIYYSWFNITTNLLNNTFSYNWIDGAGVATTYSVSVPDSSSGDVTLNPRYAMWAKNVDQKTVAAAFLLPDVVKLEVLSKNPTGTVAQIQATSSTGKVVVLRGEIFRSRTKLPSAWFNLV